MPIQHELETDQMAEAQRTLRDWYGVEPNIDDVHSIVRGMNDNDYTAAESIIAQENLRAILDGDKPDPYQEARLALRDVLGVEPDEQMIRNTMDTASRASTSMTLAAKVNVSAAKLAQAPLADIVAERPRPDLAAGFGIALSGGGFAASATVDTDDTVNGLARLRAHSALDALLDQHGISR